MAFLPPTNSTNKVVRLHTAIEVLQHWPFMLEAMNGLNAKAKTSYTAESFFNMLLKVIGLESQGLIMMLTSKNGKPLGMGCAFTGVDFNGEGCFYVWATYTTGKCKTTLSELLAACESYAKAIGHTLLKHSTPRLTSSADRLFCGLGFTPEFQTYKKHI